MRLFHEDIVSFANENKIISTTGYLVATSLINRITYILEDIDNNASRELKFSRSCSVGKPSTPTPVGSFLVIGRRPSFGTTNYQVKYATRFNPGYYYHSILLDGYGNKVLDDTLGAAISHGCIRLAIENAKWIYENIPDQTPVLIY